MAISLAEAAKLSNDDVLAGVLQTIAQEGNSLSVLPFVGINGNGLTYNRLNASAAVDFYAVGDDWDESTPTFTQATAVLKIMGGDADVDNFLAATRSNVQDLQTTVIQMKALALSQLWEDTFINGDVSVNSKSFDGLDKLCVAGQTVTPPGGAGAALTLELLDELLDELRGGKPDALFMCRRDRRGLQKIARATNFLETDRDAFGTWRHYYNGVPIYVNDYISDEQTVGGSNNCSVIYTCRFGENGLAGLHSGAQPSIIGVEDVGALETKDANRFRVKGYLSLALFEAYAAAKLVGVRPVA